jgi:hypothetical protein
MNKNLAKQIYYDIQINNFQSTGNENERLEFSESRNQTLIENSGAYSLSIVRFQLDTISLPSFIADIVPYPNTDINKMIETITFEHIINSTVTTVGPLNLIWKVTNTHVSLPNSPAPLQEAQTEYYYGNSFRHYCDIINNAFTTLTVQLKALVPSLINMNAPFMVWNESMQTAELFTEELYFNLGKLSYVNIYFNRPLYGKLSSFPAVKNYNATLNRHYRLFITDDHSTKLTTLKIDNNDIVFIKTSQEYSTISNWSPVSSIVFTSNTLPIIATQLSEPRVYSNGSSVITKSAQNFAPIISDMSTNDMVYKPNLLYVPSAQYRFIDMIGTNEIKTVQISVFWKDKKGNLNPFILQSGASASIKLLFQLKE